MLLGSQNLTISTALNFLCIVLNWVGNCVGNGTLKQSQYASLWDGSLDGDISQWWQLHASIRIRVWAQNADVHFFVSPIAAAWRMVKRPGGAPWREGGDMTLWRRRCCAGTVRSTGRASWIVVAIASANHVEIRLILVLSANVHAICQRWGADPDPSYETHQDSDSAMASSNATS